MSITSRTFLDYAQAYARRGWRVFPLHSIQSGDCSCGRDTCSSAGKHPRTKNGVKDATTDLEQIRAWWTQWPTANIGIATGIAEGETSGLYVIDVDIHKGAKLDDLQGCDLSTLLTSLMARTGSGGYHFYLSTEQRLPNTCDRLAPFVDTRGEGGYVVAPPSRNRSGVYAWEKSQPVLPVPDAVLLTLTFMQIVTNHAKKEGEKHHEIPCSTQTSRAQENQASSDAQTTGAVATGAKTYKTSEARNNYLISVAGHLRGQGLNSSEICVMLTALNAERYGAGRHPQGPLALEEMRQTIFKSVARWEAECGVRESDLPVVNQLTDLMSRVIPEPRWLVPGLLCEGLVLFAGKPKLGKSWLALGLALACAPGSGNEQQNHQALGYYPVEPAGVLYLSLEDSESRFQSRVRKLLNGQPIPSGFGYALAWKPLMQGGLQDLETVLCSAPDTRLVVIDTLARVRAPGSSSNNVYQEDYALMAALHAIVARYHVVLVLVHHTRKMGSNDAFDEISGSTGLTGAADTSMVLKRERGQTEATLYLTGRDVEEQELAMTFNAMACTWKVTGKATERQQSKSNQAILDLLDERGAMAQKDISQTLGVPKGTVYSALSRLVREGVIAREGRGLYALRSQKEARQTRPGKAQLEPAESGTEEPEPPVKDTADQEGHQAKYADDEVPAEDTGWPEYDNADEYLVDDESDWR